MSFAENAIMALIGATLIFSAVSTREVELQAVLSPHDAAVVKVQEIE